ncbi:tetratricopeptide repeat protein 34 [Tamandua tetradactyla]|uniref:tetratricopeptide repeat protein 34 n=1 Tax=Tamandua tetradactyla TaxID=48850 RepID=UPI004053916B
MATAHYPSPSHGLQESAPLSAPAGATASPPPALGAVPKSALPTAPLASASGPLRRPRKQGGSVSKGPGPPPQWESPVGWEGSKARWKGPQGTGGGGPAGFLGEQPGERGGGFRPGQSWGGQRGGGGPQAPSPRGTPEPLCRGAPTLKPSRDSGARREEGNQAKALPPPESPPSAAAGVDALPGNGAATRPGAAPPAAPASVSAPELNQAAVYPQSKARTPGRQRTPPQAGRLLGEPHKAQNEGIHPVFIQGTLSRPWRCSGARGAMRTPGGGKPDTGVTSAQELVASLCLEGDRHLALGAHPLATAFYLAAFSCHAASAVRSVRAALAEARGAPVVATLEAWCRGVSQIPAIHWDGMAVVSLTGTLASAFLAALCPDHPAAALHSLAGLLAQGCHREVVRRCDALLAAPSQQALELQLTRALAWLLSGPRASQGVATYLQAFASSPDRTVAFVRAHQQPYLPWLVSALQDHLAERQEAGGSTSRHDTSCQGLLAALDPGGSRSQPLSPAALLRHCRYGDCLAASSRALEPTSAGSRPQGERLAALLVTRAAAAFFLDGRAQDVLGDLQEAFRESPSGARRQFEALLSTRDQARIRAQAHEAADLGFARFQEAVRSRAELREDAGRELLVPVTLALRFLLRVAPPRERPALGARLAECLLLTGDAADARVLCERLLRPARPGDPPGGRPDERAPLLALRGFCALHTGDARRAREDFQAVVEQGAPHPGGCVRALCGRGLLRVLAGSAFLGALDYVTACRLRPEETLLMAKAWVPWNHRGLLLTVLREEGRKMLQRTPVRDSRSAPGPGTSAPGTGGPASQEGDAHGVYRLAMLLTELDTEDEAARLLVADALYRLGREGDAHKVLLVALSQRPQAAPVLARLALLQLRRGFFYDASQLVERLVRAGDTACLPPALDVFRDEDRQLLHGHCHARALAILRTDSGTRAREAIAYLSLAIFAAGHQAGDALLTRARCYGGLGRRKVALLDLDAALRAQPGSVRALCGRALLLLALRQPKEAVADVISALKLDLGTTVSEIRSLKLEAQGPVTQGLYSHCRALLNQPGTGNPVTEEDTQGLLAAGEALIRIDAQQPRWHILLADILMAVGSYEEAGARLQETFHPDPRPEAAQARLGLLRLKSGDPLAAAQKLQCLAEKDPEDLSFLLRLLGASERHSLTQVAAQEADVLLGKGLPGQALGYCSLAVLADGGSARSLRLRATCLTELREFGRALGDLDRVLQVHTGDGGTPAQAEDLCSRGRLLLSLGDEAGAAGAFSQALELAPTRALSSLREQPGQAPTAHVFQRQGLRCLQERRYAEARAAAERGLLVDPNQGGLKKLRARTRREAALGCRLH